MILHIDLNSFFARAEQQANPSLRNRPIGVLGKGHKGARTCVVAASPEAKKTWGVKSGMSVGETRRLCPSITLVPPDYPKYLDISRRFIAILDRASPWVEIFSIDEAFLVLRREQRTEDGIQKTESINMALAAAQNIKCALKQELGELITASVGIAWGKIFAKLAGELEKPDGLVVLKPHTWRARVGHLPVSELCGIGSRVEAALERLDIRTIADLGRADAATLSARFGRALGMRLWEIGRGVDRSPVTPYRQLAAARTVGHQITLDRPLPFPRLWPLTARLVTKVGRRLRRGGQRAARVTLHVSWAGDGKWSAQRRIAPAADDSALLATARRLTDTAPLWLKQKRAIHLGVVVGDLIAGPAEQQLPLFQGDGRAELLTNLMDRLRDRYGETVIGWGSAWGAEAGELRDWRGPRAVLGI